MEAFCGYSQDKITPEPEKVFLDGYGFRMGPAKGVRDDLYVKACTFIDELNNRFAIVSFDICGFSKEIADILKYHISFINELEESSFAICATHTHAGPACGVLAELPINYDYWHHAGSVAGNCVKKAFENVEQGFLNFNFSKDLTSTYNRRKSNINDKRVRVSSFFNRDNILKGILTRATCHAVNQTTDFISADFPSVLTREFKSIPSLFLQGSCGDINPYFEEPLTIDEKTEKLGNELYDSVVSACNNVNLNYSDNKFIIKQQYDEIEVPMNTYPDKKYLKEQIKETTKEYYDTQDMFSKHYTLRKLNWHKKTLREAENNQSPNLKVPVQVLVLSDNKEKAALVFLPFEVLCKTAYAIEENLINKGFKTENIYVISYSNGVYGYLVPKEEIELGGYEVHSAPMWYNTSMFSEKSEDTVIECIMRLVENILI